MEQAGEVDYLITWRDNEFVERVSLTPCRRAGPRADHTRCTVAGLTPAALAIDRQLQCVSPSGLDSWVNRSYLTRRLRWRRAAVRPARPDESPGGGRHHQ